MTDQELTPLSEQVLELESEPSFDVGYDPLAFERLQGTLVSSELELEAAAVPPVWRGAFGILASAEQLGRHAETAWHHVDEGLTEMRTGMRGLRDNLDRHRRDLRLIDGGTADDADRIRAGIARVEPALVRPDFTARPSCDSFDHRGQGRG